MLMLGSLLAHMSLTVLLTCAQRTGAESFPALVAQSTGGSSRLVALAIATYGIAAGICCLIFFGDFLEAIVRSPWIDLDISRATITLAMVILVIWPLCLLRSLDSLRLASMLSVVSVCIAAAVVACRAPFYAAASQGASGDQQSPLNWWSSDPSVILQSFSIAIFSFAAHTNAVPVANIVRNAKGCSVWKVSLCSVGIEFFIYSIMGIAGYLSFGAMTEQDFILNYDDDDAALFVVRLMLAVVVCFGVPLNLHPAASSILALLSVREGQQSRLARGALVTSIIIVCVFVALCSTGVADVISLIGASFGSLIVLLWPALVYRKVLFHEHPRGLALCVYYSLMSAAALGAAAFVLQFWEFVYSRFDYCLLY